jgi:hypothetical protein
MGVVFDEVTAEVGTPGKECPVAGNNESTKEEKPPAIGILQCVETQKRRAKRLLAD